MRKILRSMLVCAYVFFLFFIFTKTTLGSITVDQNPNPIYKTSNSITFTFYANVDSNFATGRDYTFAAWKPGAKNPTYYSDPPIKTFDTKILEAKITPFRGEYATPGRWTYKLWLGRGTGKENAHINSNTLVSQGQYTIYPCLNTNNSGCPAIEINQRSFPPYTAIPVFIRNAQPNQTYFIWFDGGKARTSVVAASNVAEKANLWGNKQTASGHVDTGDGRTKTLCMSEGGKNCDFKIPNVEVSVNYVSASAPALSPILSNQPGTPSPEAIPYDSSSLAPYPTSAPDFAKCGNWLNSGKNPIPKLNGSQEEYIKDWFERDKIDTPEEINRAITCGEVDTALGKVNTNATGIVKTVMQWLLGVSGGIATLLIVVSGYKFMASRGNPESIQAAREQLTSAIVGLLFVIFSLAILQIVGVDILRIPGFSK